MCICKKEFREGKERQNEEGRKEGGKEIKERKGKEKGMNCQLRELQDK